jgi:hypothetical protein
MEKFNWTPQQIAEIPSRKIREMFAIMNQRRVTTEQIEEQKQKRKELTERGGPGGLRMMREDGTLARVQELGQSHMYGE